MTRTVHVEASVQIDRPPSEVWAAVADYAFDYQWRKGLRDMTPDPPGGPAPGTKVHEVVRNAGRDYIADTVVTDVDPGSSYRFTGEGTIGGLGGGRRVAEAGSGARFTYAVDLEPRGSARFLRPLLGPMVRSGLNRDLRRLKFLLENGQVAGV